MRRHIRDEFNEKDIVISNRSKSYSAPHVKIFVPVLKPKNTNTTPSPFHLFDDVLSTFEGVSDDSNEETIESKNSYKSISSEIYTSPSNIEINQAEDLKYNKTKVSILGKLILKRKYSQK